MPEMNIGNKLSRKSFEGEKLIEKEKQLEKKS